MSFPLRSDLADNNHTIDVSSALTMQWRIQLWADRAAAPSSHWPKIRAGHGGAKQSASDTGANFHLNPQLWPPFLYENGQKAFSFRGLCPLTPTRGSAPGSRWWLCQRGLGPQTPFRLALRALAMVPPLANPVSATADTSPAWGGADITKERADVSD